MGVVQYKKEIAKVDKKLITLGATREQLVKDLREICEHKNVMHTEKYHSGGYDYCASTTHTYVCQDCGLRETKNEGHGGGFE